MPRRTGYPAFAGHDDLCASVQNTKTIVQTLLRPRAHRAVGRWPPVSRAGRRVEKNVFPKIAGVKAPHPLKVKESRGRRAFLKQRSAGPLLKPLFWGRIGS